MLIAVQPIRDLACSCKDKNSKKTLNIYQPRLIIIKLTRSNDKTYTFMVEAPPLVKKSPCWNLIKGEGNPSQAEEGVEKGAINIGVISAEGPWASPGWSLANQTKLYNKKATHGPCTTKNPKR
jgi:hypothetical protein